MWTPTTPSKSALCNQTHYNFSFSLTLTVIDWVPARPVYVVLIFDCGDTFSSVSVCAVGAASSAGLTAADPDTGQFVLPWGTHDCGRCAMTMIVSASDGDAVLVSPADTVCLVTDASLDGAAVVAVAAVSLAVFAAAVAGVASSAPAVHPSGTSWEWGTPSRRPPSCNQCHNWKGFVEWWSSALEAAPNGE